ncbi:MAG TPA: POTRA domain-containing protein [Zoogloea sp.]|mgnify:FL=1|nr:POTRA domain-containing protein [Zoogloea sp.]
MTESSQHVKVVCGACLVTSVLAMPLAGQAQVPLPGDVNQAIQEGARILREQEQYERQRRGSEALKRQRPGGEAPMLIPPSGDEDQRDSRCVDVGSLMLTGATRLSEAELADVRQAVVGKCVTSTMINGVLAKLTNLYAARGYITTRAYVPPQDVAEGVLRIVVLEGLVARIDVRPPGSASAATAFPGLTGGHLEPAGFRAGHRPDQSAFF